MGRQFRKSTIDIQACCVKWLLLPGIVHNIKMCVFEMCLKQVGKLNVVIL